MKRTVITTHYTATTPEGIEYTGELTGGVTAHKLIKYIKKVHGDNNYSISSYLSSDVYEMSDEDFLKYATKIEK